MEKHVVIFGTVGGTILSVLPTIGYETIATTVVLGAIGAATSFVVSSILKWIIKKINS